MNRDHDSTFAHGIVRVTDAAAVDALLARLQPLLDAAVPQAQGYCSPSGRGHLKTLQSPSG